MSWRDGKPVAVLSGTEFRGASNKENFDVAKMYYKYYLAICPIYCEALKKYVKFSTLGFDKSFSFSGNPDKVKLFAALKAIIGSGSYEGGSESYKDNEKNVVAYHYIVAHVCLEGRSILTRVTLREDNNGNLYYDHRPIGGIDARGIEYSDPLKGKPRRSLPEDQSGGVPGPAVENLHRQSIAQLGDGINLTILDEVPTHRNETEVSSKDGAIIPD